MTDFSIHAGPEPARCFECYWPCHPYKAYCIKCDVDAASKMRNWARGPGSKWERANMDEAMILEDKATRQTRGE